ncbi:unnamed protein product [Albugo candida]|uniref:Uncharacterized protein n=1 Tax=Albugo candida TaxID=65357 RepID=A0A024G9Q5_9STRA|nr:unnamed protein product [Albugo candida]|eukprot:CCI43478.1 unnamed protein product [Albugo candida]
MTTICHVANPLDFSIIRENVSSRRWVELMRNACVYGNDIVIFRALISGTSLFVDFSASFIGSVSICVHLAVFNSLKWTRSISLIRVTIHTSIRGDKAIRKNNQMEK